MKHFKLLLAALLIAGAVGAYAADTTIGDLDDASSVTATDDFACDQGAATKACTALQIATYIKTHFDTEAELEVIVADMANILQATEIDTEAELEAILGDVSNLITAAEINTEAELEALIGDITDLITDNDSAGGDLTGSYPGHVFKRRRMRC